MDQASHPTQSPRALPSRNEFDEEGYLLLYADIAAGVKSGAIASGWQHFSQHGFAEGRAWVSKPDPYLGVAREIAPRDEMFTGNLDHYFEVGESALHCIEAALFSARRSKAGIKNILDLPCGHGRVMRFLKKAFPHARLTACDLNTDGVDYCAKTFGAVPVFSREEIDQIPLNDQFDLIWCGSLLTHLPADKCAAFLDFFQRLLAPGGILVATTHGRHTARELAAGDNRHCLEAQQITNLLATYNEEGFSYVDYAPGSKYGFSLSESSYVLKHFISSFQWSVIGYHEQGWDQRQDVLCLQKSAKA